MGCNIAYKFIGEYYYNWSNSLCLPAKSLPEKLEYRNPHRLLRSSGSSWDYQDSDVLKQTLKDAVNDHFKYWKAGQLDKVHSSRSRRRKISHCTRIAALVFNLSFENDQSNSPMSIKQLVIE